MIRSLFFLDSRNNLSSSRRFAKSRKDWSDRMKACNPMKKLSAREKVSLALTGRSRDSHEYIRIASLKKSTYTLENSSWMRKSRNKFKNTVASMSEAERKKKFGHKISDEVRERLSKDRTGATKETCERVRKMSETRKQNNSKLSPEEVRKRHTTTAGKKWYHDDSLRISKLLDRNSCGSSWKVGRKFYENIEN